MVVGVTPRSLADPIDMSRYDTISPMMWSVRNIRLPKGAPWDFTHRAWQAQIFDDQSKELVVIKPTQIGMTTIMLAKMFHFATFNNVRAMYTLPRQDDVYDLVNGRLESIFKNSPMLAGKLGTIDNVRLKIYGSSYLHFMESSVPPRMLDADLVINDEVDISNQDHLEQYIARLDASEYGIQIKISSPTISDFGIDAAYKRSTQHRWLVKCPQCSKDQELDWELNVIKRAGDLHLACAHCGKRLSPENVQRGRWVAAYPGRSATGYAVSQLMVTSIPIEKLQRDFTSMQTKNFYNLRLGKAFTPESTSITRDMIVQNCFLSEHWPVNSGNGYFIGADQGNDIHAVVLRDRNGTLEVVRFEIIPLESGFDGLLNLFERFRARKMVVDALPNRHSALSLVNKIRGNRARVAFYSQIDDPYREHPDGTQININRSIMFDTLQNKIAKAELQFYGTRTAVDNITRLAISHLVNIKRSEIVTRSQIGGQRNEMIWTATGPDHFAHALVYAITAADSSSKSGSFTVREINSRDDNQDTRIANNNPYAINKTALQVINARKKGFLR